MIARRLGLGLFVVGMIASMAAMAGAETIVPILNGDFESPALAAGQPSIGVEGWQMSGPGTAGVLNIQTWGSGGLIPMWQDGALAGRNQVAMLNGTVSLSQSLNHNVIANSTYTMSVDIGSPNGYKGNYEVAWYAGDELIWKIKDKVRESGLFTTLIQSFQDDGSFGLVDAPMKVVLKSFGNHVVAFDNLKISHVPEPPVVTGLGSMFLLGAFFMSRRYLNPRRR